MMKPVLDQFLRFNLRQQIFKKELSKSRHTNGVSKLKIIFFLHIPIYLMFQKLIFPINDFLERLASNP